MRLVVYAGPQRIPPPIFNEKVLAGLGSGEPGEELPAEPRRAALAAVSRFKLLIDHMRVIRIHRNRVDRAMLRATRATETILRDVILDQGRAFSGRTFTADVGFKFVAKIAQARKDGIGGGFPEPA